MPFLELEVPKFPVAALPGWAAPYVTTVATSTQTPVDLGAMLFLAVLATTCARKARVIVKEDWREPLNLYVGVVLPSGEGKTPVFGALTSPIVAYERERHEREGSERAEERALYDIARRKLSAAQQAAADGNGSDAEVRRLAQELAKIEIPPPFRLLAEDCTPEKLASLLREHGGRMAVLSDEGGIFKSMAGRYSKGVPNIEVFKKAYSGGTLRVDRMGRESEHVERPALTLGIAFQPDVLRQLHEKLELRGEGLLARFLYALPRSTVGSRTFDAESPPLPLKASYEAGVRALLCLPEAAGNQDERNLCLSQPAFESLLDFRQSLEPRLGPAGDLGGLRDWANKLTGAIARIAGLLHLAESTDCPGSNDGPITGATMTRALKIGHYLIPHAKAAFDRMGADPTVEDAKQILEWVRNNGRGGFTRRDIHRALQARFRRAADVDLPLKLLEERHYLRRIAPPARTGPGRTPSPSYEVNPLDRIDAIDEGPLPPGDSVDSVNSVRGRMEEP